MWQGNVKPSVSFQRAQEQAEAIGRRGPFPNADSHAATRAKHAAHFRQRSIRRSQVNDAETTKHCIKTIVLIGKVLRVSFATIHHWGVATGSSEHFFREVD